MPTLYVGTKHLSSWSLRPFMALAHANATFECKNRPTTRAEILAVNPAGKVPVLVDGDLVVQDSLAICEYANELYPTAKLWPEDRAARARARAISAEMHSSFAELRKHMPMQILEEKPGVGHTEGALADARRVQDIWREALARSGGPFLFGHFTIADAMFSPVTTRFTTYGVPMDPACKDYCAAVQNTAMFQRWKREAITEART